MSKRYSKRFLRWWIKYVYATYDFEVNDYGPSRVLLEQPYNSKAFRKFIKDHAGIVERVLLQLFS